MKNARRNIALAAVAAATLALAPSALADVRIHLNLPLPPPPHEVLKHLPVPPLPPPPVVVHDDHRVVGRCDECVDEHQEAGVGLVGRDEDDHGRALSLRCR